jgi:hypothetical protein
MTASTFPEMVRRIFRQQTTAFKINLAFGFILRNVETGLLRYYHSSQNNARFFETPHPIRTEGDLSRYDMTSWSIFANNVLTPNG